MKDKNYEAVLKEVCDLGTHITVFIEDLGLLPEKPEEFFKEIVADKELKEDPEAYTLFFECAFRKKIVEHAQEKFLLNKAEKAIREKNMRSTNEK